MGGDKDVGGDEGVELEFVFISLSYLALLSPSLSSYTTVQDLTYVPPEELRSLVPNTNRSLSLTEECSFSYEANVYSFG